MKGLVGKLHVEITRQLALLQPMRVRDSTWLVLMEVCFASALSSNFVSFMEVLTNLCNGFLQSLALRQKDDFDKDRDGRSN